jgi:hypothetical protein
MPTADAHQLRSEPVAIWSSCNLSQLRSWQSAIWMISDLDQLRSRQWSSMDGNQPSDVLFALICPCRQLWWVALLLPLLLNPLPTAAAPASTAPASTAPVNSAPASGSPASGRAPANDAEMGLYSRIAAVNVCIARTAGVDFDKAVGIAGETIAQLIHGEHGNAIAQLGGQPLSDAELRKGAINSAVLGAAEICPKQVPAEVMQRVQEAIKQANSGAGAGPGAGASPKAGAGAGTGPKAGQPGAAAASKSVQPMSR